ncbi:hypothetical protein BDQ12DRAFT_718123 [Crucibulum laeve]|uniref:Uncharacterized protein n=1 Tax=Crucibulum laeve TaxID=68775 RepID=A0A5C3MM36_9AGAR|nr:hypothetical protein BDQ12DRAFT_718123 [Crucibulum laeve]
MSVVNLVIYESDSDSELYNPDDSAHQIRQQKKKTIRLDRRNYRLMAGSKRVQRHRHAQESKNSGQALQSITASNAACSNKSFEELSVECYMQTYIASGCQPNARPQPVDSVNMSWGIIPPTYPGGFRDDALEDGLSIPDIKMSEC